MRLSCLWVLLMCVPAMTLAQAQTTPTQQRAQEILNETLFEKERLDVPILFLGTFHFKDAGLDTFKPQHHLDVFSEKTQKDIQEIVDRLAKFKPTKIAVERKHADREGLQKQYDAYLKGKFELPANEIYQIGFRLAKQLGHTQVYPVDAPGRSYDPQVNQRDYIRANRLSRQVADPYTLPFQKLATTMDEQKTKHSLREHLLLMNDPEMLKASHGIYLQRSMSLGLDGEYPGADAFVSKWYNRNLRIFGNIHRIVANTKEDKVLAIFGAGHLPILRHFADSSAEFKLVEVADVLD